ncbi:hypothetical protein [Deinococcus altitudinis]
MSSVPMTKATDKSKPSTTPVPTTPAPLPVPSGGQNKPDGGRPKEPSAN